MSTAEPVITFDRPSSAGKPSPAASKVSRAIGDAVEPSDLDKQSGQKNKQKNKRNVRFLITEGGDVVSESVRFEKHGMPRCKATEAVECLLAGNERFRKGNLERCRGGAEVISDVAGDIPKPSTVILACSDSRVPPEIICDQGMGDCHVVRVAGNVVNDFVMGSILFAVQHLGCRLVVVLGHSRCSVVASAVQTWARAQSSTKDGTTVRSLAEGVQQTLSSGSSNNHIQPPPPPQAEQVSAFQAHANEAPEEQHGKPGFFARLCGGCGDAPSEAPPGGNAQREREPAEKGARISNERALGRGSVTRTSINPFNILLGAINGAVETVANSGEHDSFKTLVHKESRSRDTGWDSDDEELKRGLAKQDSLEFTRARLAKKKADRKIEHLRELAQRADVDSVIDENSKVSAATVLKSLVKNLDPEIVAEMEVAAGKYVIQDGSLRILSRSWYANKTYYCALES